MSQICQMADQHLHGLFIYAHDNIGEKPFRPRVFYRIHSHHRKSALPDPADMVFLKIPQLNDSAGRPGIKVNRELKIRILRQIQKTQIQIIAAFRQSPDHSADDRRPVRVRCTV